MNLTSAGVGVLLERGARPRRLGDIAVPRSLPVWVGVSGGAVGLVAVYGMAFAGRLGSLETCGADGATACVAWPGAVSAATWLGFVALLGALAVTQVRAWRFTPLSRTEAVLLGGLLVAAVIERAWRPDLADVGYDESAAASLVAAWQLHGLFPLTGIVSSVGIPNPPAWPYLLALALLPFNSPYAVVWFGIATGMLAVLLTWSLGRRWIGPWGALAAAAFYASGFWSTFLGRGGWQPVFLQVPVILCLDALLLLAVQRQAWAFALACGWLAVMVQLHYIAAMFVAILPLAAWSARGVLRPRHIAAAALVAAALLAPFAVYELNPLVRLRDVGLVLSADGGPGAHWDLEAWDLMWTLVANGGAAGVGGPGTEALRQALGRWSSLGIIGIPLVAAGLLAAVARWPRGWRGWMLAAWAILPTLILARHNLGILFHYLYLGLPGMALCVGALAEWSMVRGRGLARVLIGGALGLYAVVSALTLLVVLGEVDRTGHYPGEARPLGLTMAAADAARAVVPAGGEVLIGGNAWPMEVVRFGIGYALQSRVFDPCAAVPLETTAVYLLDSERSPAAEALAAANASLLARVPRPGDTSLIYGQPRAPLPHVTEAGCK